MNSVRLPALVLSLFFAAPALAVTPLECATDYCQQQCEDSLSVFRDDCLFCDIAEGNCETEQCITQFEGCLPGEICDLLYDEMVAGLCPSELPSCINEVLAGGEICADPDCDDVCQAMPTLVERANTLYGAPVVDPASTKQRLHPDRLEDELRVLLQALTDGACRLDTGLQEHAAGAYHLATRELDLHASNAAGPQSGTIRPAVKTAEGSIGPDTFGSSFSTWSDQGRFVADRSDGGFVAGRWVRTTGKRGVFLAAHGTCDGGATPAMALEAWLGADLSGWP